ncbi:hypothetical protein SERLADRAFT_373340 [Serpula lacrymans var. lacrymans S7.9]|uniref:Uncharacterized protein n=1 Tax=Serpula lacrymans var. lacrymans (strain S7.9) TaxID=578457 RepID=F8P812_SERL9|nr:uncharacterized protein SERLADRAFT_373340 [Serpula lacrymans var. lacrymans S7.9]EGO20570.1 hypothetical protein SERLADRAFT_373340 [Serpula lacrymans var. lacrymans S7.9]
MYSPYAPSKLSPAHLYVRQPHAIQIIQLVEGPPPPPRRISSVVYSSSAGSSSSSSSYPSTSDPDSEHSEDCSSYCSSYMTPEHSSEDREIAPTSDDTFAIRMKRVCDWRENLTKAMGASPGTSHRKTYPCETDNDNLSQSSKRSRSRDEQSPSPTLSVHSCAACDASFPSRQSLRQHGRTSQASDACRIAVEYDFE